MIMNKNNQVKPLVLRPNGFLFFLIFSLLILVLPLKAVEAEPSPSTAELQIFNVKVEQVSNGAMAVQWQTNFPSSGVVKYGLTGLDQEIALPGKYLDHSVVINNVEPDQLYHYRIVGETADGQKAQSPHWFFWGPSSADIIVSDFQFTADFASYKGFQPLMDNSSLSVMIKNRGQINIADDFYVSLLISDADNISASGLIRPTADRYSCFKEVLFAGGLSAGEESPINIDQNIFSSCEKLNKEAYNLTIAVDYNDDVVEGNELNNVASSDFQTIEPGTFVLEDARAIEETPYSAVITAKYNSAEQQKFIIEYSPEDSFQLDAELPQYVSSRPMVYEDGVYQAVLKGLQQESTYHYRIRPQGSNIVSTDYIFKTTKDLYADARDLINLKRDNPLCRTIVSQPLGANYWSSLDLNVPEHNIVRYRIQWYGGAWSPWYIPGSGDIDWTINTNGNHRRVWSYFDDHQFEYITCQANADLLKGQPSSPVIETMVTDEPKVLGVEVLKTYGQIIDRPAEQANIRTQELTYNMEQMFKNDKADISPAKWQMLLDAYIYGGYNLEEVRGTIENGSRLVHPDIPAEIWRASLKSGP